LGIKIQQGWDRSFKFFKSPPALNLENIKGTMAKSPVEKQKYITAQTQ